MRILGSHQACRDSSPSQKQLGATEAFSERAAGCQVLLRGKLPSQCTKGEQRGACWGGADGKRLEAERMGDEKDVRRTFALESIKDFCGAEHQTQGSSTGHALCH